MISPTVIGLPEAPVVCASSRSKILGEAWRSRLMGLRKCRLAIAGRGPVTVVVGVKFAMLTVDPVCFFSSDLSPSLDVDLDLDLESQSIVELSLEVG